jgi:hypothetical protein
VRVLRLGLTCDLHSLLYRDAHLGKELCLFDLRQILAAAHLLHRQLDFAKNLRDRLEWVLVVCTNLNVRGILVLVPGDIEEARHKATYASVLELMDQSLDESEGMRGSAMRVMALNNRNSALQVCLSLDYAMSLLRALLR